MTQKHVQLFFIDGVGMGSPDPAVNPFVSANLPAMTTLLGEDWYLAESGRRSNGRASLAPTDACLGVEGRPQSATGQATILTGRNVSAAIGEHYGPKPNQPVRDEIAKGSLFSEMTALGQKSALISPYPQGYFDAIKSGKRLYSSVPQAAVDANLKLFGSDELMSGDAVSPGFTGELWRTLLGYSNAPLYSYHDAGKKIASLAADYRFSFFEHWPSDRLGHRGSLEEAVVHLEKLDQVYGGLLEAWDDENGLLIITSDHGNIEDKTHRNHTKNPVATIVIGPGHAELASEINDLADIAKAVRKFLATSESAS
ncbi:MAG: 2,3-bisphosphoglycerate-independent phosphoglycerate mutase [Cellvibrionaceae bacterium]|jgi:2,3-bisphosphoglycerate-independent phosphoglycerate mutase